MSSEREHSGPLAYDIVLALVLLVLPFVVLGASVLLQNTVAPWWSTGLWVITAMFISCVAAAIYAGVTHVRLWNAGTHVSKGVWLLLLLQIPGWVVAAFLWVIHYDGLVDGPLRP